MKFFSIIRCLLTGGLVWATLGLKAQTEHKVDVKPDIVYTLDQNKYIIGDIVIDGVKDYDMAWLRETSGLEVGQEVAVPGEEISEAVRRYWKQGFFSNVKIEADSIVDNKYVYLHIYLTARPRISSINYTGVKKSEREDLESMLGLQVGGQINPDMIDRIKLIIKRHFEEKGFKNATVDVVQRDDVTGDNRVMLDINIKKNGKVKVKHIYLTGVDEKEAKKLKRAMKKTHEKTLLNLFKSKKFLPEKYEEDKGYLIDKMNEWGFRDALVLRDSVATLDEEHVDIYIDLYKGDKY